MTVELRWCDGCRCSVPDPDIASGAARDVDGRLLCRACAAATRPANSADAKPSVALRVLALVGVGIAFVFLWRARTNDAAPVGPASADLDRLEGRVAALARDVASVAATTTRPVNVADAIADTTASDVAVLRDRLDGALREAAAAVRRESATRELLEARIAAAEARIAALQSRLADLADKAAADAVRRTEMPATAPAPTPEPPTPALPPPAPVVDPPPAPASMPAIDPELQALASRLKDPAAGVRFTAVVALGGATSPLAVDLLVAAVRDRESYVRDAAVRALRRTGSLDAVPAVIRALRDTDEFVRWSARDTLRALTGTTLPFDPAASQADREAKARAIEQWWAKERGEKPGTSGPGGR